MCVGLRIRACVCRLGCGGARSSGLLHGGDCWLAARGAAACGRPQRWLLCRDGVRAGLQRVGQEDKVQFKRPDAEQPTRSTILGRASTLRAVVCIAVYTCLGSVRLRWIESRPGMARQFTLRGHPTPPDIKMVLSPFCDPLGKRLIASMLVLFVCPVVEKSPSSGVVLLC